MTKKFEIKSHDGPGRLTKKNNKLTPNLIDLKKHHITKDTETAYNVEREIAEYGVRKTLEQAQKETNVKIAVIQGSKYIDLRCKCAEELENLGFDNLIIANSDDLLLHPQDLINLIIKLRETLKPTTYLIFPFAEASFIPLLSYLGIDVFNIETAEYYAALNVLISPTKNYDLETYPIYNFTPQGLINYNKKTLDLVLREVREHMHNNSLRNLVEERTNTSPQNTAALRILDKDHSDYLQKYTQLY
ncbi:archaeosine tRNA-ribosyltransferase [Methanobrevibacter acididurans]|uniref:archaeosine tRNA-ribosyltransferase n=1 Tax=Methanobrevibacter acididurans TaxID=120963 RepID=UPI0038FCFF7A